ncbi:MAG: hypothetical protein ACRED1_12970 [Limisphaerales bacterium]
MRVELSPIFGFFYLTRAVLPHPREGAAIINTTSIQASNADSSFMTGKVLRVNGGRGMFS